jgi:hypothetical protein
MIRFVSATPRQVWLLFAFACLFIYPLVSLGQGAAEFKGSDRAAVEKLLDRYVRAYSAKDYAALRDCLQAPFARFPERGWELMGTLDEVMTYYKNQRDTLDKDYDHSSFIRSKLTVLSAERVLVDQVYRRYRKDGSLLLEAGAVYVGCKSSGTWKVCGTFAHDVKEFGKAH